MARAVSRLAAQRLLGQGCSGGIQLNTNPHRTHTILAGFWALILIALGAAGAVAQTTPQCGTYKVGLAGQPHIRCDAGAGSSVSAVAASNTNAVVERRRGDTRDRPTIEPPAPAPRPSRSIAYTTYITRNGSPRADAVASFHIFPAHLADWSFSVDYSDPQPGAHCDLAMATGTGGTHSQGLDGAIGARRD